MPRYALLEHTGAPDDPTGRHVDLLVEDGDHCRTWRLSDVPLTNGPSVTAVEIAPHRKAWLDHLDGPVSGGRGRARRIDSGTCRLVTAGEAAAIEIGSGVDAFTLRLENGLCAATRASSGRPDLSGF
jgi:hypothetical protein